MPRSEPWLIEGAEDASNKPFVASDDDDAEDMWEVEQDEQDEREDAFADWQPEPSTSKRAGRR